MPHYSITAIASKNAPISHLTALSQKLANTISQSKGVLRRIDNLGVRPLSHRMKAHQQFNMYGRYIRFQITASPKTLMEVEKRLKVDEGIVRFLTIKEDLNDVDEHVILTDKAISRIDNTLTNQPILVDPETLSLLREHSTNLDFVVAKTLLNTGIITPEEIASLPRQSSDESWDAAVQQRQAEKQAKEAELRQQQEEEERIRIERVQSRIDTEFSALSRYHRARQDEAERADDTRKQWAALEKRSAVERFSILDQRLIAKRVRKELNAIEAKMSRAAQHLTAEQRAKLQEELTHKLTKQRKRDLAKLPQPVKVKVA